MIKKWSVSYPAVNGTEQRRVYVYLPTMYEADPDRRYPVLYMFDGQNVFFDEDATFGKSWGLANYLDYTDTVFGQVYEGMDVVDAIGQTAVDENQKPREDITINSVSIETYQG